MIICLILRRLRLKIYSNSAFSPVVCGFVSLAAVKFDGCRLVKFTKGERGLNLACKSAFKYRARDLSNLKL